MWRDLEPIKQSARIGRNGAMRDHDALWLTRRSRCEDYIGRVVVAVILRDLPMTDRVRRGRCYGKFCYVPIIVTAANDSDRT